jgi:predicted nuclease of predicted toxin-antitoxin system
VKLLFDQNLSHRLVAAVGDVYPESAHVREFELQRADDASIWEFAKQHGFVIVTKDADFHQRSFLFGHPPKVVWLQSGNCSTARIQDTLRRSVSVLAAFEQDEQAAFLPLP